MKHEENEQGPGGPEPDVGEGPQRADASGKAGTEIHIHVDEGTQQGGEGRQGVEIHIHVGRNSRVQHEDAGRTLVPNELYTHPGQVVRIYVPPAENEFYP